MKKGFLTFLAIASLSLVAHAYEPGQPVSALTNAIVRSEPAAGTQLGVQSVGATGVMVGESQQVARALWHRIDWLNAPDGWVDGFNLIVELDDADLITLKWNDNSDNEVGFKVERAEEAGGFLEIFTTAANIKTYVDNTVQPNKVYQYKIRAYNAGGHSEYSNTVKVRIKEIVLPPAPNAPNGTEVVIPARRGRLVNTSTRTLVSIGDEVAIIGVTVADAPLKLLLRAVGPTLAAPPYNVSGVLADPQMSLADTSLSNDNWSGQDIADAAAQVGAFALPVGSKDAAMLVTLNPGTHTIIVSGVGNTSGVAIVETYEVP